MCVDFRRPFFVFWVFIVRCIFSSFFTVEVFSGRKVRVWCMSMESNTLTKLLILTSGVSLKLLEL